MQRLVLVLRSLAAVLVGYALLAATNMLFVILWWVRPLAAWPEPAILLLALPYTLLSATAAGYVAAWIAGRRERRHAAVLAAAAAVVLLGSLLADVAVEPTAYKLVYLVAMLPAVVWGGVVRARRSRGALPATSV